VLVMADLAFSRHQIPFEKKRCDPRQAVLWREIRDALPRRCHWWQRHLIIWPNMPITQALSEALQLVASQLFTLQAVVLACLRLLRKTEKLGWRPGCKWCVDASPQGESGPIGNRNRGQLSLRKKITRTGFIADRKSADTSKEEAGVGERVESGVSFHPSRTSWQSMYIPLSSSPIPIAANLGSSAYNLPHYPHLPPSCVALEHADTVALPAAGQSSQ
jgi:hypothetical protein